MSGLRQNCNTLFLRHPYNPTVEGKFNKCFVPPFPVIEDYEVLVSFGFPGCSMFPSWQNSGSDAVLLNPVFSLRIAISAAKISLVVRQILTLK